MAACNYVLASGIVSGVSPWRTAEGADGECSSQNGLEEVAPSQRLRNDVCYHFLCLAIACPTTHVDVMSEHQPDSPRRPWRAQTPASSTAQLRRGTLLRRRGGIEPLCVSTPRDLKSCPSTSPTRRGGHAELTGSCIRTPAAKQHRPSRAQVSPAAMASQLGAITLWLPVIMFWPLAWSQV